jgi:hypothetical protein
MVLLGDNFFKACFMGFGFARKRPHCGLFVTWRFRALQKLNVHLLVAMVTLPTGFIVNYCAATRIAWPGGA